MKSERDGINLAASQAEQVASNAWLWADGGFIFADAPNAVTSAAVIVHQISMHRNITPRRVTRSSRASSRASSGFTTIARDNPSPARSFKRPHAHPLDQPVPGPDGAVPSNWQTLLHE